ncbi:hypothetical protein D1164_02760 [Mariniphaga sediminis]|uniref:Uncharacterized protein n=1 Tax=Mariniphaga sediminis TaxID=1628158 RepID=A0A399CX70_9BACT|nr:hypothetical protein D1164_15715 [Mariniphaga sediminis]RIH66543.1 hypothetical protein D1164_02760 [Mariniphaga sediminis]
MFQKGTFALHSGTHFLFSNLFSSRLKNTFSFLKKNRACIKPDYISQSILLSEKTMQNPIC